MNHKILLELYLPPSGQMLEIRVPRQVTVATLIKLLGDYLKKREEAYLPSEDTILCDFESGKRFSENAFIEEIGIGNGARVMLV